MLKYDSALTKKMSNNGRKASNKDLLKWLLTLLNLDIDRLSQKDQENLEKAWIEQLKIEGLVNIKNCLSEFKGGLNQLIPIKEHNSVGTWKFEVERVTAYVSRFPLSQHRLKTKPEPEILISYRNKGRNVFLLHMMDLLQEFGRLLFRCEECNSFFLKSKRQEYCSTQCGLKVRQRRFYAAHKEEIKEKRRQYSEQREEQGIHRN